MKIALIGRCDNTGLGNQTLELAKMLDPDLVVIIDFTAFRDLPQYPKRYKNYKTILNNGMISNHLAEKLTTNYDVIISCETFYNDEFVDIAKKNGCKTVLQYNYELYPGATNREFSLPDVLVAPSSWNVQAMNNIIRNKSKLVHIPPPTDEKLFAKNFEYNVSKTHNRLLHVHGTGAAFDRNGTIALMQSLRHCKTDFELVIKTQVEIENFTNDSRVTLKYNNPDNHADLYYGFDATVLPRRYGGLCLPMNESLMSGLPVLMTNIEPNNAILPREWLFNSNGFQSVRTKIMVNAGKPNPASIAAIVDRYVNSENKEEAKRSAYNIGYKNFSPLVLKERYVELLNSL
jgi:glycosyltransferase involved in cell wall biosynthesis